MKATKPLLLTLLHAEINRITHIDMPSKTNLRKDSVFIRIPKIYKKFQAKLPLNYFTSEQLKQSLNTFDVVEFANETIHS
jgi:hypothetical protein